VTRLSVRWMAGSGSRFAADAFDGQRGGVIPLKAGALTFDATIVDVVVAPDGASVDVVLDVAGDVADVSTGGPRAGGRAALRRADDPF